MGALEDFSPPQNSRTKILMININSLKTLIGQWRYKTGKNTKKCMFREVRDEKIKLGSSFIRKSF